jgi:hypothetical protein
MSEKMINLTCECCKKSFERRLTKHNQNIRVGRKRIFCSNKCRFQSQKTKKKVKCKECSTEFLKYLSQLKKSKNNFCSRSCAVNYNNAHKTKGTTVSKLEKWLQTQLDLIYPDLEILYNDVETIKSELDIYIPSLQLAFELNGPFHYEPIFGKKKLQSIQENDQKKFHLCIKHKIDLCVIDTSQQKYFKESTSEKYLDIIINAIDNR